MHQKRELSRSLQLIKRVCQLAGDRGLIRDAQRAFRQEGLAAAVHRHDNMMLFDWLAETFSYQGISNRAALSYMQQHGRLQAHDIVVSFSRKPSCPKLRSYWHFEQCGYSKTERICSELRHFSNCPLPTHDLRNGRLNQAAYSLFLFLRDITGNDLVAWLDARLSTIKPSAKRTRSQQLHAALLEPLSQIFGVSDKVVSMTLAIFLLAADPKRKAWISAGANLIAIDRLVHNFFIRTGLLRHLGKLHPYGPRCYEPDGCADIIGQLAGRIDARRFNEKYPRRFPRFVQHAIWHFCAEEGLNECNGRQIDDHKRCNRKKCPLFEWCARVALSRVQKPK
jgi:hypothetical protein